MCLRLSESMQSSRLRVINAQDIESAMIRRLLLLMHCMRDCFACPKPALLSTGTLFVCILISGILDAATINSQAINCDFSNGIGGVGRSDSLDQFHSCRVYSLAACCSAERQLCIWPIYR